MKWKLAKWHQVKRFSSTKIPMEYLTIMMIIMMSTLLLMFRLSTMLLLLVLIVESWKLDISYRSWPLVTLFVCDNALQYVIQSESLMNDRTNNHQFCCLLIDFCCCSIHIDAQVSLSEAQAGIPENQRTVNLVLRMRNTRKELNDIRFEFQVFYPCHIAILCNRAKVIVVTTVTIPLASVTSFFQPTKDSADGIANELLSAGLIGSSHWVAIS